MTIVVRSVLDDSPIDGEDEEIEEMGLLEPAAPVVLPRRSTTMAAHSSSCERSPASSNERVRARPAPT